MFGTDGIRGKVGEFPVCDDNFFALGVACAEFLKAKNKQLIVAVGRDTRASGKDLLNSFGGGFFSNGGSVIDLGVVPTPCVSMYVMDNNLDLGAAITASHNPFTDNGIKFFKTTGSKLSKEDENEIEAFLQNNKIISKNNNFISQNIDGTDFYINRILKIFNNTNFNGKKIVIDSSNGATSNTSAKVFEALGASVISIFNEPNGQNINLNCGSEHTNLLQETVLREKAWLGIAHDGDGDRLVIIDENGSKINGDVLLGVLAIEFKKIGILSNNTLVTTIQSNSGLTDSLKNFGIIVEKSNVGDREVFFKMQECNASLGGEESGHIIIKSALNTGDGLIAALQLAKIFLNIPVNSLTQNITLLAKAETSILVKEKKPLNTLINLSATITSLEKNNVHTLVRYSGTEQKLRILVESSSQIVCNNAINTLISAINKDLI